MKGLVITGGEGPDQAVSIKKAGDVLVCAADSGLERALQLDIVPDFVVGDMDSLENKNLLNRFSPDAIEYYSHVKDFTDTEIAIEALRRRGITEITILGGGGGRLDHLVGIMRLFDRPFYPRRWLTDREVVQCFDDGYTLEGCRGETISLFPVGKERTSARTTGLRWPLDGLEWDRGDVGISNEVINDVCRIEVLRGRLLLIRRLPRTVLVP
jgi:thiamine pyrophosphokinase